MKIECESFSFGLMNTTVRVIWGEVSSYCGGVVLLSCGKHKKNLANRDSAVEGRAEPDKEKKAIFQAHPSTTTVSRHVTLMRYLINQIVEIFVSSPVGELLATCGNPGTALLAGGKQTIRMSRCEAVARGCRTRLAADLMMETPHLLTPPEHTVRFLHSLRRLNRSPAMLSNVILKELVSGRLISGGGEKLYFLLALFISTLLFF
ncbi:hypothetical protein CDAR_180381 [Caerostris darwini]|uniref:Uncharacterized protein n=1 Tax=Caerostris darwini TaxID=1538125 RepID=A0AAV4NQ38_9ARAC|nr:hypothetical protein CDAR_180381 [Caerostris darwini]